MDLDTDNDSSIVTDRDEFEALLLESAVKRTILASLIAVSAVCGAVGDCLMLYVYARHCRGDQRKKYLIGIVIAALIISVIYYPLLVLELLRPDVIIENHGLCVFTKYTKLFAFMFYLFSVLIVSVWNYIFFAYPLKGRIWIKTSRVAGVWVSATFVALVFVVIGYLCMSNKDNTEFIQHFRCWDISSKSSVFFIKTISLAVAVPCLGLVTYFSCSVYALAYRSARKQPGCNHGNQQVLSPQTQTHAIHHKKSVRKQSCLVGLIFFTIWVPFVSVILIKAFCRNCIRQIVLLIIGDLFFFLGSFAPMAMFLLTKKYRNALLFVITRGRRGGHSFHGGSTRYEKTSSNIENR